MNASLSSLRESICQAATQVREQTPLAESFTNFVTINFVANAQLAAGGTAAMSFMAQEVIDIAKISGAVYINVGTLLPFYTEALQQITQELARTGKAWVLDPVAAGLGDERTIILTQMKQVPPSIVRGNASEIMALESMWGLAQADEAQTEGPAGVESADEVDAAISAAMHVAQYIRATRADGKGAVAVSGESDLITDGERIFRLQGGNAMMTKITGAGCSLGGVMATYACVSEPLVAALAASMLYNRASDMAADSCDGPGSFQTAFLDALWKLTPEQISAATLVETPASQQA